MIVVVTPLSLLALVPIAVVYVRTQRYYIRSFREVSRLDSLSRSPIYALFGETLHGLSTIRAFQAQSRYRSVSCVLWVATVYLKGHTNIRDSIWTVAYTTRGSPLHRR